MTYGVRDSPTLMTSLSEKCQTSLQQRKQDWVGGDPRPEPESVVILVASVRDLKLHSHPWCESQPALSKDLEIHKSSVLRMTVLGEKLSSGHK